jgi:SPP1 gp7 family putative phage head morphogenesis protein
LARLRKELEEMFFLIYESVSAAVIESATSAAVIAASGEFKILQSALGGIGLNVTAPNQGVIETAARNTPMQGQSFKKWFKKLEQNDFDRSWREIVEGVQSGKTTPEIINAVIGTKEFSFMDGVRQVSRRSASTLVRTSITHTTNTGRQKIWEDNSDFIQGVQWVSTLDSRTSPICRFRDGQVGAVSQDQNFKQPKGTQPLSPPFARPPAHPNCRSTMVAVTKSFEEMGLDVKIPAGTRASMSGQVAEKLTYYQWLEKQSEKIQREVLGETRFQLWKKDGVKPEKFHDDEGVLLTLEQLESLSN